jgi:hypothetical protein
MISIPPRALLAGPILRRADRKAIHIWVAVSSSMRIEGKVFDAATLKLLGHGTAQTIAIGGASTRLHVALVKLTPADGLFPVEKILGYNLVSGDSIFTLPMGQNPPTGWSYRGLRFPTLVLRDANPASILHASCRKPHGHGVDALRFADQALSDDAAHPTRRPSALYLTGDQIYADDVADSLIHRVSQLAPALCGVDESVVWPGHPSGRVVSSIGRGERGPALKGLFSSGEARNHLIGFGEYAAMYLLAWGQLAWGGFPAGDESRQKDYVRVLLYYVSASFARRLLANVPTYMIFDDHDVTDDWNLTTGWTFRVNLHPLTRRVVCNALAAFAVFQGWGNDPTDEWPGLLGRISRWVGSKVRDDKALEDELLGRYWGYSTPPHPKALVLDTRSHRVTTGRRPDAPPILLDHARLQRIREELRQMSSPLLIVSPVPLVGVAAIDFAQSVAVGLAGKEAVDYESWAASAQGQYLFRGLLHERARISQALEASSPSLKEKPIVIVLSGDVHYSACMSEVVTEATGMAQGRSHASRVLQFTSSASKNAWVDPSGTEKLRLAVANNNAPKQYAVFMNPSPAVIAYAIRKFSAKAVRYDARARGEAISEAIAEGAPVALDVIDGVPEVPTLLQEIVMLRDTETHPAVTFNSSVGWLFWNEDQLHMRMIEGDGNQTETVGGELRPKLRFRDVKITRD